jgi:hypothetical protein
MRSSERKNWRNWTLAAGGAETPATEIPNHRGNLLEQPGPDGIRWGLVRRVQAEIAAGTYDTEERFETAADRMLARLAG